MSRVKPTVSFIRTWQHPDEIADEVDAELRFHVEMRMRANLENGMMLDEARLAAQQSFGDFDRVKDSCCEIKRGFPFDLEPLRMGLYIAIACIAGGVALWAVNIPHHNVFSVLWQLSSIAVLMRVFLAGRRNKKPHND